MSTPPWQPRSEFAARFLGFGFTVTGGAILYWQIVISLERAAANNPSITYSLKLIALGEMFAVLGLYWLATGLAGYTAIIGLQKDRRFMIALGVVALIAILATDHNMTGELATYGYAF